jgi:hypothetical protein
MCGGHIEHWRLIHPRPGISDLQEKLRHDAILVGHPFGDGLSIWQGVEEEQPLWSVRAPYVLSLD